MLVSGVAIISFGLTVSCTATVFSSVCSGFATGYITSLAACSAKSPVEKFFLLTIPPIAKAERLPLGVVLKSLRGDENSFEIFLLQLGKGKNLSFKILIALSVSSFHTDCNASTGADATCAAGGNKNQGSLEPGPINLLATSSGK